MKHIFIFSISLIVGIIAIGQEVDMTPDSLYIMKYSNYMEDSMLYKRTYYNYTDFDSLQEKTEYIFDDESEMWMMDLHETYFYNDDYRLDYIEYEDYIEHIGGGITGTYTGTKDYLYDGERIHQIIDYRYIEGERNFKFLQQWDDQGRRDLMLFWRPADNDTAWFLYAKTEYQYNAAGYNTHYLEFRYNILDNDTVFTAKEQIYNDSGQLTESNSFIEGINRIRRITYDEENRKVTETNKQGVWPSPGFENETLVDSTLFYYSAQLDESYVLVPTENGIDTSSRTGTNIDIVTGSRFEILFLKDEETLEWSMEEAWETNYLNEPDGEEVIHKYWVEEEQFWLNAYKNTNYHNEQGRDTARYEHSWSYSSEEWMPKKHLYMNTIVNTPEADSVTILKLEMFTGGTWVTENHAIRSYKWHEDGSLILYMVTGTTNLLNRVTYDEFDRRVKYEHAYNIEEGGDWNFDQIWTWYYTDETHGFGENTQDIASCWYNCNDKVICRDVSDPTTISVFSINGALILSKNWSNDRYDVSFLDSGAYVVVVEQNDNLCERLKIVVN